MNFLVPRKLRELRDRLRRQGMRAFLKDMGWKVVLGVLLFYLIRDTLLYLIIPYLIARGILGD